MEICIKPMETEAEILGKGYVHWKSWQETYPTLVGEDYLAAMTLEKCQKNALRWRDNILVAKDGERVVGFAGYGAYRDDTMPGCGEVYAIYLLAEYHGQGIGYRLMNAAMEELREYPKIALWVLRGNNRAIRFYEKYGFTFDGAELETTLGIPCTELRMIYQR